MFGAISKICCIALSTIFSEKAAPESVCCNVQMRDTNSSSEGIFPGPTFSDERLEA